MDNCLSEDFCPNFKQEIINIPLGPSIGQCCGGYVQIKLELYKNGNDALKSEKNKSTSLNDLYIFGAGHVGQQLSSRVTDLDFNVNLIDSRESYLNLQTDKNVNKILAKNPWLLIKNFQGFLIKNQFKNMEQINQIYE